jgi:hypothetical protein
MAFTVEEFRDLVRILEEHPEWRAELRRLVLTDELLTLPELVRDLIEVQRRTEQRVATIEEQLAALIEAQQRTEQEIATLVEVQRRAEQRIGTLTNDMADVKGVVLELRYHHRAHAYFAPLIRRTHVLSGEEIETLLEGAVAQGLLSEAEADEILADLLLRGRRRGDNSEVYVVVEISWKIDPYDVERSVRRAALLSRIGTPAVPMVAGKEVIEEAASLASMLHVWQLTNGQAIPPHQPGTANDRSPNHA